ncbi:hypothetical protein [Kribbella sp. NPDC048915]|uniref:hypothetical protein n=1 Tax=Kribbella sp. NPDC048915 TaxID=3155148 RepID=UPI00340D81E7
MPLPFLTAVLAAFAFLLPALPAAAEGIAETPEPPDRIAAAWRTDRLYVDERLKASVPATEIARIRAAMKTAALPAYVAIVPKTPALEPLLYDLPTLLHARVGEPGLYLVATVTSDYWSAVEEMYRPAGLRGRTLTSVQLEDKQRLDILQDRPAPQIVRTIQQASRAYDGRAIPPAPPGDLEPDRKENPNRGPSLTDQQDRAAFVGIGIGALAGLVLVLILALRGRDHAPTGSGKRRRADRPVLEAPDVAAKADAKIRRAQQALARLERRRHKTADQLDLRDDAHRRLDAARALRAADHQDDVLAAGGALVLARQAEQAAAGKAVQPPCFFNPVHLPGTVSVNWSDDVEVPACQLCANAIRREKTPDGLRVPKPGLFGNDRQRVPYWTLDPEDSPMVATGFGALSDDLPEQLATRKDEVR